MSKIIIGILISEEINKLKLKLATKSYIFLCRCKTLFFPKSEIQEVRCSLTKFHVQENHKPKCNLKSL